MTIVFTLLAAAAVILLLWLWAIGPQLPRADFTAFHPFDYAHRGLHDKDKGVPENSLKAFELAVRGGFGMEFDLQLTRDGQIVVHHDLSISRTCGVDRNICDMTYEELSGYRLFGTEERVPLFSQVLELVGGRTPLIIELKSYTRQEELCQKTMEQLEHYRGLYCVESFDPRIVRWFRKHFPRVIRGQLSQDFFRGSETGTVSRPAALVLTYLLSTCLTRPDFIAYRHEDRRNPSLRLMRRLYGVHEVGWTVRSRADMEALEKDGVTVIFENFIP